MIRTRAERQPDGSWRISGRKWYITGAEDAAHFILIARTSDDPRYGLTAFLFHRDQPGWEIVRRIPIMGPEEHGGHCELAFDGLTIKPEDVLGGEGKGLKVTQVRLGPARLTIACAGSASPAAASRSRKSMRPPARVSACASPSARACS